MNEPWSISVTINGEAYKVSVSPNETLLDLLRERLGLVGTKEGCDTGDCGSCTVLVNGKAVNSCLVLAVETNEASVATIEGMSSGGQLHPLQQAFIDHGAIQCGFCTPGTIMAAKSLLEDKPNPTEEEIQLALAGNLCRCADYVSIMKAITAGGKALRGRK
jgi:carbon-monoxide dehydrogenase small subunit